MRPPASCASPADRLTPSPDEGLAGAAMPPLRVLVSVRDVAEAMLAARAGVPLIDLKEPRDGALGGLPPERVRAVVRALREQAGFSGEISATIGDHAATEGATILQRIAALAGTGVDVIKVGLAPAADALAAPALLRELAVAGRRAAGAAALVPVLIADAGLAALPVAEALTLRFHAVMLDTERKGQGSLIERLGRPALAGFIAQARAAGCPCGLAGALRLEELALLRRLGPDFAGFRSAVCEGARTQALAPGRLARLLAAAKV